VSTIEDAFASVFAQDFNDYEYIVIDGGSIDGTLEIIKQNESKLAYWVSEPDNGVYDAMNKAVRLARGKWIYFLGADDVLFNILDQVAEYLTDPKTIYYGDVYRPLARRRYDGAFSAIKLSLRNICHQSIFYPENVFKKNSFNLKYPIFADYAFNMHCFADPGISMIYIPLIIAVFNDAEGMSSNLSDLAFEDDRLQLVRKYFSISVYTYSCLHFAIIRILTQLRLKNIAKKIYHSILTH
jgi:glycosyltransferase involved in cell wall biosynthesis